VNSTQKNSGAVKHALILPNGMVGADAGLMVEYATAAEEAGWDGFFPYDVLINPPPPDIEDQPWESVPGTASPEDKDFVDPWIVLAGIATRTEHIKLGTWITPLPRRQPWQVARDVATLDRLSSGRVIFGVGLGKRLDYEKFGMPWDAKKMGQKYDEALEIIDRFWRGERFSFHGEHYTLDDVALLPTPLQKPRVPILVAGFWPNKKPFQRGARWDGIMPVFGVGPDSDRAPEDVLREMLTYYHSITDEPGDIFLPVDVPGASSEYISICKELGATWLYTYPTSEWSGNMEERIREGPPKY
jgi:alkanesulfonate monooxygenase SsuD/methylene tetrahydromethanopterin reductase-like flavin-dependent oxidoreductase (luciferase family)